jgi:integrase
MQRLVRTREEQARAGKKAKPTADFYRKKSGHLVRLFEGKPGSASYQPFPLAQVDAPAVDDYISTRRAEGVGENTISKELVALRMALKLALRANAWEGDIRAIMPIGFSPEYRPRKRFLTQIELYKLLGGLTADKAARAAFIVATSACASEAEHALRNDVGKENSVQLRGTKRPDRWRMVPIELPWQRSLLAYAVKHGQGQNGRLFLPWGNVRRDLILACEAARIDPCSPNDLRRTFSHWMKEADVPNEVIAPLMGHKTTKMVEIVYGKQTPEELGRRLRRCITGASPSAAQEAGMAPMAQGGTAKKPEKALISVPRDRIELPTRGFSILCSTN